MASPRRCCYPPPSPTTTVSKTARAGACPQRSPRRPRRPRRPPPHPIFGTTRSTWNTRAHFYRPRTWDAGPENSTLPAHPPPARRCMKFLNFVAVIAVSIIMAPQVRNLAVIKDAANKATCIPRMTCVEIRFAASSHDVHDRERHAHSLRYSMLKIVKPLQHPQPEMYVAKTR